MQDAKPSYASRISQAEILAFLKATAIKELEVPEATFSRIGLKTPIVEGLQLDSVAQVVLVTAIEEKYDFLFDLEDLERVETVLDLVQLIQKQTQHKT
jgi:acyl carrier protein